MTTYTAHMVPHCFGRYLIDLPADMQPASEAGATFAMAPYSEFSGAIRVTVEPMTRTVFDGQLARRRESLESEHIDLHPDWPYLDKVVPLSDGSGVIFDRSEDGGSRGARTLELHGWKDNYAVKMTVNAGNDNYPEYEKLSSNLRFGNDVPRKISQLQSLYARIRGRQYGEVPSESGVCIKNGFVSGKASEQMREDIVMGFVSKSMPDINFSLSSDSGMHTSDTLLDRSKDVQEILSDGHGRILHKGSRESKGGVDFDEVLTESMHPDGDVLGQHFSLEANSEKGGPQTPLVNVEMGTGNWQNEQSPKYAKSSLNEAESVALWNAATTTLRQRPGAF